MQWKNLFRRTQTEDLKSKNDIFKVEKNPTDEQ